MKATLPRVRNWGLLIAVSATLAALLHHAGLPAGLMLGPMLAAVLAMVVGMQVRLPGPLFVAAQGVIGCMIARGIPPSVIGTVAEKWPLFFGGVAAVTIAANALGWVLARLRVFPGTTAVWGASPGGASTMTLMAESYGADTRLVAFMQYLRVVCVAVVASLVAHLFVQGGTPQTPPPAAVVDWFEPVSPWPFLATLVLAVGGAWLGGVLRIPAGALLLPMALGTALHLVEGVALELPPWLLALAYAFVGWNIGMRFTRPILAVAWRALPKVLISTFLLIGICGLFALALVDWAGVDPLTAYLATSPGGADSVAIIAATSHGVDMPFVLAMQTLRFVLVMFTGPAIARFIAGRVTRARAATGVLP
ncbi:AbrB family transcriptional regulator [Achromobacter aloeverae]|uniref:Ammonia monooxygenase n=1 Tax=Achromobacter aloeverae TaxID=1750518 RepID=A0A4Q1HHP3_9BURK|nr:AbrB family transcriptional regulator [Achromobacter aloeverae]RXN86947.1 ammonia monooxygenase [Achromobacter aloeverae]